MRVRQYISDDIDELHNELLMIDDECWDKIVKFAAIWENMENCRSSSNS